LHSSDELASKNIYTDKDNSKMKYAATVAALAASIASVSAGTATIKSFCGSPVYLWAVDANRNPQTYDKQLNYGDTYTESYQVLGSGGVSLKLSRSPTLGAGTITQFEYTYQPGTMIWYDGSNVNCAGQDCPFYSDGVHMTTSVSSCATRTCAPGVMCDGFYNKFNDDWNSLGCDPSADITMYLCATDGKAPSVAEKALFPQIMGGVNSAVPSIAATPHPIAEAAAVHVPTTMATAVASPSASSGPVFQMEAIHVPSRPKQRREMLSRHNHMRRHAHDSQ